MGNYNRRWAKDQDGGATVEFVIVFPIFMLLLALLVDTSLLFHSQAQALRVLQDANRNYSLGRLEEESEVTTFITNSLASMTTNATINVADAGGIITSAVSIPSEDVAIIGWLGALMSTDIVVQASHIVEN